MQSYDDNVQICYYSVVCLDLLLVQQFHVILLSSTFNTCCSHRPLHLAARNGLVPVVQELIARGANLLAEDEDGHNPALACAPNPQVADCLALILVAMVPSLGSPLATSETLEKTEDNLEEDTIEYSKLTHNATV